VVGEIAVAGEVVDAVRVLEPDVVLLHLHMPELDGARLTSYIRAASPGVSVLVMTDDHTDELLRDAVHAGARGCIGADLDGPALARAVLGAARGDVLLTDTVLSGFVRGHRLPDGVALTAASTRSGVWSSADCGTNRSPPSWVSRSRRWRNTSERYCARPARPTAPRWPTAPRCAEPGHSPRRGSPGG
jgi:DNA-binding NarL/FixJ family response regulator